MSIQNVTEKVERWGVFELTLKGPEGGNPFLEVNFDAEFRYRGRAVMMGGFYDGDGIYKVRFMPDTEGYWTYTTKSGCVELNGITGSFLCTAPGANNHGPVRVKNTFHFEYEDKTPYYPFGTTCYAWIHQGYELEEQTLNTLKNSPFNKLRMCVFPKDYSYNKNEPVYYPFEGSLEKGWDYTRFNPEFFRHLEKRIMDLGELGIEADLILFHCYDRWGYSNMDEDSNIRYLTYLVRRLSAYRNIWWSLANEFDFVQSKTMGDWDRFFKIVQQNDPFQHLRSIHNGRTFYDHGKPWVTHCSIQSSQLDKVYEWRNLYNKPIIVDECCYEGNIEHDWGNITDKEMVHRFWKGFCCGGYVGHGETYIHPQDILWWSKGGVLYGKSPERIAFLRKIIEEGPSDGLTPYHDTWQVVWAGKEGYYYLMYFGINQPYFKEINLPESDKFEVEIIDTWEMTITPLPGEYSGKCRIELPAKQYIALRIRRLHSFSSIKGGF